MGEIDGDRRRIPAWANLATVADRDSAKRARRAGVAWRSNWI